MFICNKCGLCCRNINRIPELKEFDSGNGVCIHLTDDNLCEIYSERPDVCNVQVMYEKKYKHLMSQEDYDKMNMQGCALLRNEN